MGKLNISRILLISIFMLLIAIPGMSTAQSTKIQPLFSITGIDMEISLDQPSDIFIDENHKEIYIADAGNRRIVVLDMDGFYKYQFSMPDKSDITGLIVDNHDEILVALNGKMAVYNFRGEFTQYVDLHGFPNAENVKVIRIKMDKQNNYYIFDSANRRILIFDNQWNFKFAINKNSFPKIVRNLAHGKTKSESMLEYLNVGDFCIDDEGTIYIIDFMAAYVFVFRSNGEYLRSIGEPGSAFNNLSLPNGVSVDSQGRILVINTTGHGLLGYDKEGKLLFAVGGLGKGLGNFYFPKYVSTDRNGRIYIVEPFLSRIQILKVNPDS